MNGGVYRASHICPHCLHQHEGGKSRRKSAPLHAVTNTPPSPTTSDVSVDEAKPMEVAVTAEAGAEAEVTEEIKEVAAETTESSVALESTSGNETSTQSTAQSTESADVKQSNTVVLTSKPAADPSAMEILDEVSAECVLNIKLTPDLIKNGKFVGSKSEKIKAALMQGKKHALNQLRQKAQSQGANIVFEVTVKNVVKAADSQKVSLVVRAAGTAAITEAKLEECEV